MDTGILRTTALKAALCTPESRKILEHIIERELIETKRLEQLYANRTPEPVLTSTQANTNS